MLTTRTLGAEGLRRHLEACEFTSRKIRQTDATRILSVYSEDWQTLAVDRVAKVYTEASTIAQVVKFVSTERNLLLRVTDNVSVAYVHPPRRSIAGKSSARANKALTDIVDESGLDVLAEEWARLAFVLGVVHVVPVVRKLETWPAKRLCFDTILPHNAEAIFADDDPSTPAVLLYEIREGVKRRVALDAEAWTYFDQNWQEVERVEHGLGRMPAVQFRVRRNLIDYWDIHPGTKLVAATLELARISAYKGWVRKCSSSKLATFFSTEIDDGSDGPFTPEKGLSRTVAPSEVDFKIHDYITPVKDFIDEMKEIAENVAESFGIPSSLVDPGNENPTYSPGAHAALSKIRRKQVKHLARAEAELFYTAAQMMERAGHPLAPAFPADRVRVGFAAEFPLLTYVDEPLQMLQVANERIKLGQSDPVELYVETHPGITEAEAMEAVERHIEVRGKFTELQARHGIANVPQADPRNDGDNKAQQEGRQGGSASPPPKDEV